MGRKSEFGYRYNDWDAGLNIGGPREGGGRPRKWVSTKTFRLTPSWGGWVLQAMHRTGFQAIPPQLEEALTGAVERYLTKLEARGNPGLE